MTLNFDSILYENMFTSLYILIHFSYMFGFCVYLLHILNNMNPFKIYSFNLNHFVEIQNIHECKGNNFQTSQQYYNKDLIRPETDKSKISITQYKSYAKAPMNLAE